MTEVIVKPLWRRIVEEVCAAHRVGVRDVLGRDQRASIVAARFEIYYRLADETPLSSARIGVMIGGRDHTSVLHGLHRHAASHGLPRPRRLYETGCTARVKALLLGHPGRAFTFTEIAAAVHPTNPAAMTVHAAHTLMRRLRPQLAQGQIEALPTWAYVPAAIEKAA